MTYVEKHQGLRRHLLLPKLIKESIPPLYHHENDAAENVLIHVKFFSPYSGWRWYATEGEPQYDEEGNEVDFLFFGYVDGMFGELGYFSLSEIEQVTIMGGVPAVERDQHFPPCSLAHVMDRAEAGNPA